MGITFVLNKTYMYITSNASFLENRYVIKN